MRALSVIAVVGMSLLAAPAGAQTAGSLSATLSLAQHDFAKDADVEVTVTLTNATGPLKSGDYGVRPAASVASGAAVSFRIR